MTEKMKKEKEDNLRKKMEHHQNYAFFQLVKKQFLDVEPTKLYSPQKKSRLDTDETF